MVLYVNPAVTELMSLYQKGHFTLTEHTLMIEKTTVSNTPKLKSCLCFLRFQKSMLNDQTHLPSSHTLQQFASHLITYSENLISVSQAMYSH